MSIVAPDVSSRRARNAFSWQPIIRFIPDYSRSSSRWKQQEKGIRHGMGTRSTKRGFPSSIPIGVGHEQYFPWSVWIVFPPNVNDFFFNKLLACQPAIIDRDSAMKFFRWASIVTYSFLLYPTSWKFLYFIPFRRIRKNLNIFLCNFINRSHLFLSFCDYFPGWRKKRNVTAASSSPRNIPMFFNTKNVSRNKEMSLFIFSYFFPSLPRVCVCVW
jgi:hypothetical protein